MLRSLAEVRNQIRSEPAVYGGTLVLRLRIASVHPCSDSNMISSRADLCSNLMSGLKCPRIQVGRESWVTWPMIVSALSDKQKWSWDWSITNPRSCKSRKPLVSGGRCAGTPEEATAPLLAKSSKSLSASRGSLSLAQTVGASACENHKPSTRQSRSRRWLRSSLSLHTTLG